MPYAPHTPNRRRANSRHAATPPSRVLSWTADGTDYVSLGASVERDFEQGWCGRG